PGYQARWKFFYEASLQATAKWMTDWGAATVFLDYRADVDESDSPKGLNHLAFVDSAYAKVGGLLFGYLGSTFDYGPSGPALIGYLSNFDHDQNQTQIQWSTTVGGYGFFISAEDQRDNVRDSELYSGNMTGVVVAVPGSTGGFDFKLSGAITDTIYGTGWAAQIGAGYTQGGNFIKIQAAVSNDAGAAYSAHLAPQNSGDTYWHVTAVGGIA